MSDPKQTNATGDDVTKDATPATGGETISGDPALNKGDDQATNTQTQTSDATGGDDKPLTPAQKKAAAKKKRQEANKAKRQAKQKADPKPSDESVEEDADKGPFVLVTSAKPRRRCGMRFGPNATRLYLKDVTEDMRKKIDADPNLKIRAPKVALKA